MFRILGWLLLIIGALFAACTLLVIILGRRFLIRGRWARMRRARAEEARRMTDLLS